MASLLPTRRFTALADLTAKELDAVVGLVGSSTITPAGQTIRLEGEQNPGVFFLQEGWAAASMTLADGDRQIFKVHLPGDMMGAPSLPYAAATETLTALTRVTVSIMSHAALSRLFAQHPRLAMLLFLVAQQERVTLMDRMTAMGRLDARRSMAALLVHLYDRIALGDPDTSTKINIPLSQPQLADVLGLTPVHVNRTLRQMQERGDIRRRGRLFDLVDVEHLRQLAALPRRTLRRNPPWLPPPG